MTQARADRAGEPERYVPQRELRWEPSPRWVRATLGGQVVADSKHTLLVWDNHYIPVYFFPREDVVAECLVPTGRGQGERTTYHVLAGGTEAQNAAWSYTDPQEEREALRDYVAFRWNKMDAWYEEDEQVFVHARDPYRRVDVLPSTRHVEIFLEGVKVADSQRPDLLFETGLPARYYLPPEDVNTDLLRPSETQSQCPYKGTASYMSIHIDDSLNEDLIWTYPDPIPEIPKIKGLLAFFNEKVDIYVDGVLEERPRTFWS